MVAGTAFAAGGAGSDGSVKAPQLRGGLGDPSDATHVVDGDRGPFYGLRVNSMNFAADAKNVANFEYTIAGFLPGDGRETYQLVRTAWRGDVTRNMDCDEVLGLAFPAGASLRYVGRMVTTRWIRDVGPNGKTPVGGFVGEFSVAVTRGDTADAPVLPLLALRVIGTQGLRPMRGDPTDPTYSPMDRCSAPLHDEGFYQGGFDHRTLTVLAKGAQDAGNSLKPYRALWNTRIIGTFEGRLDLAPTADPLAYRFGALSKGAWWFDGLMGWKADRAAVPSTASGQ
jgi:hypothetical protein